VTRHFFAAGCAAVREQLKSARPLVLALDFDGTLAPIAATPERARMATATRRALERLGQDPKVTIAFVSGRGIEDLADKTGLRGAVLVGNHGLISRPPEISGRLSRRWENQALRVFRALSPVAAGCPGSRLELKGIDVSLHYRQVASRLVPALLAAARSAVAGLPVVLGEGKKVLEIKPPLQRHKGWALRRLARRLQPGWRRGGACVYLGDDRTDEDAFAAIHRLGPAAWGIKVGPGATRAGWRLRDTAEVRQFLEWLAGG